MITLSEKLIDLARMPDEEAIHQLELAYAFLSPTLSVSLAGGEAIIAMPVYTLVFHLYGIGRDAVDYIMESFPIVRRKDEAQYGQYRTKRVIREMYGQMTLLPHVDMPVGRES